MSFSLILTISFTIFMMILVPLYWKNYGPQNFLWFSDIGLFLTLFGLWLKSPLLISMAAVGVLPFEIIWNIEFFYRLFRKKKLLGIVDYMFDSKRSIYLRSLSLFHIVLPFILLSYLFNWGYDDRALKYQTMLFWVVLGVTYFFSNPKENINWVFAPRAYDWYWMPLYFWLLILAIFTPIFIFWPLHCLFEILF